MCQCRNCLGVEKHTRHAVVAMLLSGWLARCYRVWLLFVYFVRIVYTQLAGSLGAAGTITGLFFYDETMKLDSSGNKTYSGELAAIIRRGDGIECVTGTNRESREWKYAKSDAQQVESKIITALNITGLGLLASNINSHVRELLSRDRYDCVHIYMQ